MGSRVQGIDVHSLGIQRIGDDFVGTALISDSMQHDDHAIARTASSSGPAAVEKAGFILRDQYSVLVSDRFRKALRI
jgi:hypothetical protein